MPESIDAFNKKFQHYREILFRPLLGWLTNLGVSGNFISNFRLPLGIIFLFWFYYGSRISAVLLVIAILLLDIFDGALARFQKVASDRGKFLDILVDHCVYAFIILAFLFLGASAFLVSYNLFIVAVAYLLAAIKKEEGRPSDWIIKPYPRLSYLKAITVIPFFLSVFYDWDFLNQALLAANALATLLSIYYFIFIQRRWLK